MTLSIARLSSGDPEIFRSIQGEGVNSGTTAVFLRLAFCNLKCGWCDTRYTWDWQQYRQKKEVVLLTSRETGRCLRALGSSHLVVTGGEPLIQQKSLGSLLSSLKRDGYYIELETNGTISPTSELVALVDHWNVSPKLENSGNPRALREVPEAYGMFVHLSASSFKYVIQSESDLDEVQALVDRYCIDEEKIVLMPEASDRETLIRRGAWLAEACKDRGYSFSTRLQILLQQNTRGA